MDFPQSLAAYAALATPVLAAVGAVIRVAHGQWVKDRDAVVAALTAQINASVERERGYATALERSVATNDRVGDYLERVSLVNCPACAADLRSTPPPGQTGQHRAGVSP